MADEPKTQPEQSARATMIYLVHNGPIAAINASMPGNLPKDVAGQPAAYLWKDVLIVGDYIHPIQKFHLDIDKPEIAQLARKGNEMRVAGIPLPINCDHSNSARDVVGYIVQFRAEGARLLALCQFIGADAPLLAARNYVSVGIDPDFVDGKGKHWGQAIAHLALTPVPVVPDQEQFIKAASRLTAAGDVLLLSAAETHTQRSLNMASALSDGQVGTLRKQAHLCMANVPDDGVGDHLVNHHAKQSQALATMCSAMGDSNCPAEEAMSRATGYIDGMKHLHAKIMPKTMSMAADPKAAVAAIEAQVSHLSSIGNELELLKSANTEKDKQIQQLSAAVPKNPFGNDAALEKDGIQSAHIRFDQLGIGENPYPPVIIDALKQLCVSRDGAKAQAICLSHTANQGGKTAIAYELCDILERGRKLGFAPKLGEKTRLQALSRVAPGDTETSRAKEDDAAIKFMSGAGAK